MMCVSRFRSSYLADGSSPPQKMEELIKEVRKHQEPVQKRIALTKLLEAIYKHKHLLGMPSYAKMPDYEEIHQQALQDTILVVSQKIDTYEPEKPFLPWVKGIFKNKFYDALKQNRNNKFRIVSLDSLDYSLKDCKSENAGKAVQDFIRSDPENILKNTKVRGCPHITLQKLMWLILVEDLTWETVATELNSKISTLSSFYQRNIQKHKAYFLKYLSS